MKLYRIFGYILRHVYVFKHSLNRMADAFYWPLMDLILWGLTIFYMKEYSSNPEQIVLAVISGIILWLFVWRSQYEISVNLLEELWSRNLINIFGSPLKFSEWLMSTILLGLIKSILSVIFTAIVAYFMYRVQIFVYGFYLIPFIILLMMTGWCVGFFVAGLIFRYGTKVEQFAWSLIMIIAPFSAIYYPLSILPDWAQKVAGFIPTSYIFEGMREVIETGKLSPDKLLASFGLNCIYLALSLLFIRSSFKKVLEKGLVKVY